NLLVSAPGLLPLPPEAVAPVAGVVRRFHPAGPSPERSGRPVRILGAVRTRRGWRSPARRPRSSGNPHTGGKRDNGGSLLAFPAPACGPRRGQLRVAPALLRERQQQRWAESPVYRAGLLLLSWSVL